MLADWSITGLSGATLSHHSARHPEEPRACAASRRMAASAYGPSFEARRRRRAPQDDGWVGLAISKTAGRIKPGNDGQYYSAAWATINSEPENSGIRASQPSRKALSQARSLTSWT